LSYELNFLKALLLTLAIELAVGLIIRKVDRKFKAIPLNKFVAGILFASTLTLPYVWLLFPIFFRNHLEFTIIAELFAFIMEALFYRFFFDFPWKTSLFFSFSLNLVSFVVGLAIF